MCDKIVSPKCGCFSYCSGLAADVECSLPPPTSPFVGRNLECEEIVANLTSTHRRIGIICGVQGIGKTAVAVQVGQMLLSKGWNVHYYLCKDQDANLKISELLSTQAINEISHPTLFVLDNVDVYDKTDGQDKIRNVLQSFVDSASANGYAGLLFVARKEMHFLKDIAFLFNLQPLSSTSAVELLNTAPRNVPVGDLNAIAEACDNIPLTLMVARGLIEDGMSEMDIINEISSSDKLRMDKGHKLDDSHSSKGEKSLHVTSYSHPLRWPCSDHEIGKIYPMFAPKEVASLRKKLKTVDDGRSMPFYRETEQAIYNMIESLDEPPELDFLLEPTDGMFLSDFQEVQDHAS